VASQRRAPVKKAAPRRPAITAHEAQAAVEDVTLPPDRKVSLLGVQFKLAGKVGVAPMILLAVAGKKGIDSADAEGVVALHDLISDCIAEDEYDRFWAHAVKSKADMDDLQQFIKDAMEALSARPTGSPSGSSAGRRRTSANSKGSSPATATPPDDDGWVDVDSLLAR
jgi:hypothetical protein